MVEEITAFSFIKSINTNKIDIWNDSSKSKYNRILVNRYLSTRKENLRYLYYANTFSNNEVHYKFLLHSIPASNTFLTYPKEKNDKKLELLKMVSTIFNVNMVRAFEYSHIMKFNTKEIREFKRRIKDKNY